MSFLTSMPEGVQFLIQIIIVLLCLFFGARKGGIALGLLGGIGLFVLVFLFSIPPGKPAISVMLTILAVVCASATLEASGGLNVLLLFAEKILRKNPKFISILAPLTTCTLTILCGTGHVVYAILPIIYDISIKNNIRPERAMASSSVASQLGIIASPVSVATITLSAYLLKSNLTNFDGYIDLLKITIPSTYIGVLVVGIYSMFRGKNLENDEEFKEKLKDENFKKSLFDENSSLLNQKLKKEQIFSVTIFLSVILVVSILGYFKDLRPSWEVAGKIKFLGMTDIIQIFMLLSGALILFVSKIDAGKISKNEIFRSGMIAMVAVFGISWMAESMFEVHTSMIKDLLFDIVKSHPWTYALMLLIISKFINSQSAAIVAFVPLALGIGVNPGIVCAFAPACYGYFILPTYPSDLAAIQFDRSGTTKIGKFVINHSFIIPGIIGVFTSCLFGYIFAKFFGYIG